MSTPNTEQEQKPGSPPPTPFPEKVEDISLLQAINVLINSAVKAQKQGVFNLQDAHVVFQCINKLSSDQELKDFLGVKPVETETE